mmetsp:Transcript_33188/g.84253  ORF Transcript_33188/g.84253 Transcript_33188/m.84253 type:complete len:295 (-) Transcript_33188:2917-3801(-)
MRSCSVASMLPLPAAASSPARSLALRLGELREGVGIPLFTPLLAPPDARPDVVPLGARPWGAGAREEGRGMLATSAVMWFMRSLSSAILSTPTTGAARALALTLGDIGLVMLPAPSRPPDAPSFSCARFSGCTAGTACWLLLEAGSLSGELAPLPQELGCCAACCCACTCCCAMSWLIFFMPRMMKVLKVAEAEDRKESTSLSGLAALKYHRSTSACCLSLFSLMRLKMVASSWRAAASSGAVRLYISSLGCSAATPACCCWGAAAAGAGADTGAAAAADSLGLAVGAAGWLPV